VNARAHVARLLVRARAREELPALAVGGIGGLVEELGRAADLGLGVGAAEPREEPRAERMRRVALGRDPAALRRAGERLLELALGLVGPRELVERPRAESPVGRGALLDIGERPLERLDLAMWLALVE
jgi:hypothetical protein